MSRIPRTLNTFGDVFASTELPPRYRLMALALLHASGGRNPVKVSLEVLGASCGTSRQSARNTIRLMERDGWMTVEYGSMVGQPNTYCLDLDRIRGEVAS